jgi:hypothetical protein
MPKIMSLNEQRVHTLNKMRGGYYHVQKRLNESHIEEESSSSSNENIFNANDLAPVVQSDVLKSAANAMYAATGDVLWLSF